MSLNFPLILCLIILSLFLKYTNARSPLNTDEFIPHAFIQTGEELHYFSDVNEKNIIVAGYVPEFSGNWEYKELTEKDVQIEPKTLEFDDTYVGIARKQIITIKYRKDRHLIFLMFNSKSIHFHCSFPNNKVLTQDRSTTFTVYFLPLYPGEFETTISIFTSNGLIQYQVKGKATHNPYRIQAISGLQIPVNGTFVAPLTLHNPYSSTLTVFEIATTSNFIHLELPGDELDEFHDDSFWEIAPFETRKLADARIIGGREMNTTAYISMKIEIRDLQEVFDVPKTSKSLIPPTGLLVIPMDFKLVKKKDLFSSTSIIDFGLVKADGKSEQIIWEVYSTITKSIDIDSITVEPFNHQFVYVELVTKMPITVPGGSKGIPGSNTPLVKLSLDGKTVMNELGKLNFEGPQLINVKGRIVGVSRGGNYNISVPYKGFVYSGNLLHNPEDVAFHYKLKTPIYRSVSLMNALPFGLAIRNVSLDDNAYGIFKAMLITPTIELTQEETKAVVLLQYLKQQSLNFTTKFTIHTNVTDFHVPIVMFDGDLKIEFNSIYKDVFDFGVVELGKQRSIYFTIINENPVQMIIRNLQPPLSPFFWLEVDKIGAGNNTKLTKLSNNLKPNWQSGHDFTIPSKYFVTFKMTVTGNLVSSKMNTELLIQTEFAEYSYPVKYSLTNFSVYPVNQFVNFGKIFPGMISTQEISLLSTFNEDLLVDRISVYPEDPRFYFQKINDSINIQANSVSKIAKVILKPDAISESYNYLGFEHTTSDGQWFSYGMNLPFNLAEIDHYLYRRMRNKFNSIVNSGYHLINSSIIVDTPVIKNLEVPIKAELIWPKLLSHSVVHFPMTAVGNFTIVNLTLTNPSLKPVIVQILPLVIYRDPESFLDFFRYDLPAPLLEQIETNETLMFSLRDTELFTLKPSSPVPKLREQVEEIIGTNIPKFTLSMILQPKMKTKIRLGFLPSDYRLHSSLLIIRNNLTVIEPIVLYGKGAHIDMTVDNNPPKSTPSLFDIQPGHLKECLNPLRQKHELASTLTLKRQFKVVNSGEVPFTVTNMTINNIPCENRGFHIINCEPFKLTPGETYLLEIAYTPDFLMSVNDASLQLYMHMNGTPWVFFIGATIPPHMLQLCHSALPRPPFEHFMYYSCIIALTFCLSCVLACSYIEGDRMIACTVRQEASQEMQDSQPTELPENKINTEVKNNATLSEHRRRPSHYRHHVRASDNSMFFVRWSVDILNVGLWLFSIVWMKIRKDPDPTSSPNKRKNRKTRQQPPPIPEIEKSVENEKVPEEPIKELNDKSSKKKINKVIPKDQEKQKRIRQKSPPKIVMKKEENIPADPNPVNKSQIRTDSFEVIPEVIDTEKNDTKVEEQLNDYKNETIDEKYNSEESEVPEWAFEEVNKKANYEDDYAEIVTASADIFSSRAETPASSSSQSSISLQIKRLTESEFTTDDTTSSRIGRSRYRRQKQTKSKKKEKGKEKYAKEKCDSSIPNVNMQKIDLLTQQFREKLIEQEQLSQIQSSSMMQPEPMISWPMSVFAQNQTFGMPNPNQMYYQNYINHWNQYQLGFNFRPYNNMYESHLDPLYENARSSPRDFSSDISSQPSADIPNPFQNSLGPIGARPTRRADDTLSSLLNEETPQSSAIPSTTNQQTTQYNLFTGNDPIWQPLVDDLRSSTNSDWPQLNEKKIDE